jgi:hypothetical protein
MSECRSINKVVLIINDYASRLFCEILTLYCIDDNRKLCSKLFSVVNSPETLQLPVIWNGVGSQASEISSSARRPVHVKFSNRLRS